MRFLCPKRPEGLLHGPPLLSIAVCSILVHLITACTEPPPGEQAVALVDNEPISRTEVEEFAAMLLPGLRSDETGDAARLDYLQTLIDERLLVLEARAQGLDTTRAFTADFQKASRREVIARYRKRHLDPRITIAENEVRARFERAGLNRERALSRLVVKTEEQAARLREQLQQGAGFGELAKAHSLEKISAPREGYVGFVDVQWASRLHIPPAVFDDLPLDQISHAFPLKDAYQLVLFKEDREGDFSRYRQRFYRSIWKQKMDIQRRALAEELSEEFGLRLQDGGLEILKRKPSGARLFPELSPQEEATPLYVYEKGTISVGAYVDAFRETGGRPGLGDSLAVVRAAWQRVIPDILFWEAARRQGYDKTEAVARWRARKEVEYLLKVLRKEAVKAQVNLTEEKTKQFYRDNLALFSETTGLLMQEVLVGDLADAAKLRQRLDSGEDIDALVHLTERQGAEETDGKLHLHSYEEGLYGDLVTRALVAEVGEVVGPVKTKGGYSIFKLTERSGGQPMPFEEVKQRVAATLRYREEEQLFNVLMSALREKYADRIRVFDEVLSDVRLPEDTPSPAHD